MQVWRLCAEVERREGFDALGFLQGDPYSIAEFGSVGAALQQAVTLQDAIETFCTLLPTIADANTAHLVRGEELSWFVVRSARFQYEFSALDHYTILPLREIIRLAAGPDWRPEKIRLLTSPKPALDKLPDTADIETFFNQNVVGIAFKTELLAAPVRQSGFYLEPAPQEELSVTKSVTESESLYRVLASMLPHRRALPSAEETASIFGMSRATLFRRLVNEGVTFHRVIERVRLDAAKRLLDDPTISLKELAYELGYSAPSNFAKSFRRMSSLTPGAYRKKGVGSTYQ
jgi:AraC-like DNA-binding protein